MASKYNVGNLLFPKKFEKLFGYVLATFGIFGGFLEDFFGTFVWRIFLEDFFGEDIFYGGFFGGRISGGMIFWGGNVYIVKVS